MLLHILHCPLSGPDLTDVSLLITFGIIEYVTNKKKLKCSQIRNTDHILSEDWDALTVLFFSLDC